MSSMVATPPQRPLDDTTAVSHEETRKQENPKTDRPPLTRSRTSDTVLDKDISQSPSKLRSLSDASKPPSLSPSPAIREPPRTSKDDISISVTSPSTPRRPNFPISGLSLQMPQAELGSSPSRIPLSPKLDSSSTYGSPASVLPRRSRGLDFSRACTNLHLSTLAESSPDSSPVISGHANRAISIPRRKSFANSSTVLDSPSNTHSNWSVRDHPDRQNTLSSSVSSVNMLDSTASDTTSSSEDEAMDRDDDMILSTPQVSKLSHGIMNSPMVNSPGNEWMNNNAFSPAAASLMSFQRARLRHNNHRSRHSSSSASGRSSRVSPGPLSPSVVKSVEQSNGGFFGQGLSKLQVQSRRESLSLGNNMHFSDSDDDGDQKSGSHSGSARTPSTPGVMRRAVTRRSNLLPKTKTFARIRAALAEEATPIDSETKREAEVIHQVRESDPTVRCPSNELPAQKETLENVLEDETMGDSSASATQTASSESFSQHVERNSAGLNFWHTFDDRYHTPPPQGYPRKGSIAMSEDSNWGDAQHPFAQPSVENVKPSSSDIRSRSSTPVPTNGTGTGTGPAPPTANEIARKVNKKRRRDDDLDPIYLKRRAVSPSMSVASSPVLPQSPVFSSSDGGKSWGHPPPKANGHGTGPGPGPGDRSNSGSSGSKRVGFQGMTETNDSLMNMSIE